jgi:hypothetical protein
MFVDVFCHGSMDEMLRERSVPSRQTLSKSYVLGKSQGYDARRVRCCLVNVVSNFWDRGSVG